MRTVHSHQTQSTARFRISNCIAPWREVFLLFHRVLPSSTLSFLKITNRPIRQEIIEESIVIPPSTRMIWICSRQNHHHLRCDAEELGLASAGIDEVGYADGTAAGTAGNLATLPAAFKSLNVDRHVSPLPSFAKLTDTPSRRAPSRSRCHRRQEQRVTVVVLKSND